jgi:hypothetical protein
MKIKPAKQLKLLKSTAKVSLALSLVAAIGITNRAYGEDIYSQGTRFGELIKASYKGEGKDKVFEAYLLLPSGEIWKFNTLRLNPIKYLTAFVKVDYVQPDKEEPAFKGATTPYDAVKIVPLLKFKLKRVYKLPKEKILYYWKEEGYNYSHGFRCGRVQKITLKTFKVGWFSKKKAMQLELALTNIYGLPAVDDKGRPIVWKAVLPSNQNKEGFFETFEEGTKEDLYNILLSTMGKFVCLEYIQKEPNPKDPFNYRIIGVVEVIKTK